VYSFIRDITPMPVGTNEAVVSCAAKAAVDLPDLGVVLVFSEKGTAANLASKYRPACPILVVTSSDEVVRHTNTVYAQYPYKLSAPASSADEAAAVKMALKHAVDTKICRPGATAVVISGVSSANADLAPKFGITVAPGVYQLPATTAGVQTVSLRATAISLSEVFSPEAPVRKTKIVCTMGPKCWDEDTLGALLDSGMGVARFNFSHGTHEARARAPPHGSTTPSNALRTSVVTLS
jgi:pyruvate kinase